MTGWCSNWIVWTHAGFAINCLSPHDNSILLVRFCKLFKFTTKAAKFRILSVITESHRYRQRQLKNTKFAWFPPLITFVIITTIFMSFIWCNDSPHKLLGVRCNVLLDNQCFRNSVNPVTFPVLLHQQISRTFGNPSCSCHFLNHIYKNSTINKCVLFFYLTSVPSFKL